MYQQQKTVCLILDSGEAEPPMPHDTKLVLYSMRFCPFAHRAHLALNAKNIPYHVIYINLSEKPEWFTTLNPNGRVPALLLKNEPHQPILVESMLICEYLDEKYPDLKLYPSDPLHKAETKLWIQRFDNCHGPYYRLVFAKPADDAVDEQLAQLFQAIDEFEVELTKRGSGFFGGDRPNILDYAIWPWFERFGILKSMYGDKNQFNEHRYPTLVSIFHANKCVSVLLESLINSFCSDQMVSFDGQWCCCSEASNFHVYAYEIRRRPPRRQSQLQHFGWGVIKSRLSGEQLLLGPAI